LLRILTAVLVLATCVSAPARAQGELDGNENLFAVLAAIHAAGFNADLDSPSNHPVRLRMMEYLSSHTFRSVAPLREFFEAHRRTTAAAELGQYISYALMLDGPPDFRFRTVPYRTPPEAELLQDFSPLLADFYAEADIGALWKSAQGDLDEVLDRYHEPTTWAIQRVNGYLRNPASGAADQVFRVVVSLLSPPNQVHTRSYDGEYFVVVTPSTELQVEEIRYSYLHHLLDPMATANQNRLMDNSGLGNYALGAPYLPDYYKFDFLLLATTSLIRAIEARLADVPDPDKEAMVQQAYRRGYILAPHFWEQLPFYEEQDQSMRLYFPEMVESIDLFKEEARAQTLEFDQTPPDRTVRSVDVPGPEPTEAQKTLMEAENLYHEKQLDSAREIYLTLLRGEAAESVLGSAYYGLARIATLQNDPELALTLFRRTLDLSTQPEERAWSLVYLGRLLDLAGEPEEALRSYQEALTVNDAPESAVLTARQGVEGDFRRQDIAP